jgi:hypothetical protein
MCKANQPPNECFQPHSRQFRCTLARTVRQLCRMPHALRRATCDARKQCLPSTNNATTYYTSHPSTNMLPTMPDQSQPTKGCMFQCGKSKDASVPRQPLGHALPMQSISLFLGRYPACQCMHMASSRHVALVVCTSR